MSDVADLIEPLKRAVAVPGTFRTAYPNTTDNDLVGSLMDGFWKAKLDGWLTTLTLDLDAQTIGPTPTSGEALSDAGKALVIIYTAIDFIRTVLMNAPTRTTAKVEGVEYTTETGASILTTILKSLEGRREELVKLGRYQGNNVYVFDAYPNRAQGVVLYDINALTNYRALGIYDPVLFGSSLGIGIAGL